MAGKIQTKKQKTKVTFDTFDKTSVDGATKFWRCEFKDSSNKCKGRIWTDINDNFLRMATPHTCPANAARVDAQKVTTAIKRRAIATFEPPSVIHSEAFQNVPSPSGLLVTKQGAKELIKRVRHGVNATPVVPANLQQLVIGPVYQMYTSTDGVEEQLLLGDSGVYFEPGNENPQRILLFGRASFGRWADRMTDCFGDGTFSLAPPLFYQIYTILAKRGNWVIPVCHILLTAKTQVTYERMLALLRQAWPTFSPTTITLDFELAMCNSVTSAFGRCKISFCFFHFVRNLQKKVKEQHLGQRYCTDAIFAENVRMISSVAFVPLCDVRVAVAALDTEFGNLEEFRPLVDWLLVNYVGQPRPNGTWSRPMFRPEQWMSTQGH